MLDRVLQRFDVRPAEQRLVLAAVLCLIMLGAAGMALLNATETLFLKRVGVESLPLMMLASSGLLVVTTAGLARLGSRSPVRLLPRLLALLGIVPLLALPFLDSHAPVALSLLVLAARQIFALGVLGFWMAMAKLIPARRAKQLFAPVAAGVTTGAIVGSFGSQPLADLAGLGGLFVICSLSLAGAAAMALRLGRSGRRRLESAVAGRPVAPRAPEAPFLGLLRTSVLFRHLTVALFCGGVLNPVLYYEFSTLMDAASQGPGGEERLLALYAQVRGVINIALLVTQVGVNALLFRTLGLPLTMATWPFVYLLGFGWLAIDFALVAALVGGGSARVIEDGISDSASRVLYNLFPEQLRGRVSGLLEGPVNRVGGALGFVFVLVAVGLGTAPQMLGVFALPLATVWLTSALVLWRSYPRLLLAAAAEHGLAGAGVDRAILVDASTLQGLAAGLVDPDPHRCRAAADLVVAGDPDRAVPVLADALGATPGPNRKMLVDAIRQLVEQSEWGSLSTGDATDALLGALAADPPFTPGERGDLLRCYARLTSIGDVGDVDDVSTAKLQRALGDRDAPVRLAAITELHRRGAAPPGLPDLDRVLSDALSASDARIRRAARRELRAALIGAPPDLPWANRLRVLTRQLGRRADRAETAEALRDVARVHPHACFGISDEALRYLEDRDPRVRASLLELAGLVGRAEYGDRLVAALGAPVAAEVEAARQGLVALGAEAAVPLLIGLELGAGPHREELLGVLRELEVDAETLEGLHNRQLDAIRAHVMHRAVLDGATDERIELLCRRLDERIAEAIGALLALLAALNDDTRLAELERRFSRADREDERDLLVEAIEASLARSDRQQIVPLLEHAEWGVRGARAARDLDRTVPDRAEALRELRSDVDDATRRIAESIPLDGEGEIGDPRGMPSMTDIAIRLQAMPVFDRLSVPQGLALAELLQEQKLARGERVFGAGDEVLALYFVLDGQVDLQRDGHVVESIAAGGFFGERSALEGLPPNADAVAQADSRLMRLDREDLLGLLENAPTLAIGLAQRISARVRELEDRLAASPMTAGAAG